MIRIKNECKNKMKWWWVGDNIYIYTTTHSKIWYFFLKFLLFPFFLFLFFWIFLLIQKVRMHSFFFFFFWQARHLWCRLFILNFRWWCYFTIVVWWCCERRPFISVIVMCGRRTWRLVRLQKVYKYIYIKNKIPSYVFFRLYLFF